MDYSMVGGKQMIQKSALLSFAILLSACQSTQDDSVANAGQSYSTESIDQFERQHFRDTGELIKCDSKLQCHKSNGVVADLQLARYVMPQSDKHTEWQLRNEVRASMGGNCWKNRADETICMDE